MLIFVGVLSVVCSGLLAYFGHKVLKLKPNYQTEKTLGGYYVRFLDYSEANRLKRNRLYGAILIIASLLFIGIGICTIFTVFRGIVN